MKAGSIFSLEVQNLLCEYLLVTLDLEGDIIEFGVFAGGMSEIFAQRLELGSKTIYACDTFSGIPPGHDREGLFGEKDQIFHRDFTLAAWIEHIHIYDLPIEPVVGKFEDTLGQLAEEKFCFALLDADTYEGTRTAWEFIRTRVTGIVVFDDYEGETTPGFTMYVNEVVTSDPNFVVIAKTPQLTFKKRQ